MELDILIFGRVVVGIITVFVLALTIKARISKRLGNEFFIIVSIFWVVVLAIIIKPSILDSVLNNTGFVNRSQFLLSMSFVIILYLLANQTKKGKIITTNFHKTIRAIGLHLFQREWSESESIEVVIIIAAKNEEKTLLKVIEGIKKTKISYKYKILVVNDGSSDKTEEIARTNGTLVVTHYQNLGVGGAIKTGYLACKIIQPKIVVTIDGDGQHNPQYIPKMIKEIEQGADLVYGSRFSEESQYESGSIRLIGNKFYTNLVNKIGRTNITDVTSGYRAVEFDSLKQIYFISESNFAIELALRAAKNKLVIKEIPVKAEKRIHGKSQLHRIEKFLEYNINAVIQIVNAFFRKSEFK